MKRKKILGMFVLFGLVATIVYWRLGVQHMHSTPKKIIILGFDGMDPFLLERFWAEGHLAHFKELATQGTFRPLQTTIPPESPVAWASFETGTNPGGHNVYDFLTRSTETYMPNLGMVEQKAPPKFLLNLIPIKPPIIESMRKAKPFWVYAGENGIRSTVLTVPLSFPPDEIPGGKMLAGLPLPDIRGTVGTFYYWATDLSDLELGEMDGKLARLEFDAKGTARSYIAGPVNPILKAEAAEIRFVPKDQRTIEQQARLEQLGEPGFKDIKIQIEITKEDKGIRLSMQGDSFSVKDGEWSDWKTISFKVTPFLKLHGMGQFYLVQSHPEVKLYMSPVNWDPRNPPMPITKPNSWSKALVKEVGLYRTVGWAESTFGLNEERIDEAAFIQDANTAMNDRLRIMENELNKGDWNLFISVYETTDRYQHMFWRLMDPQHPAYDPELAAHYGNAIRDIYDRADDILGRVMKHVDKNTLLMVVSDHGANSFRKAVNLNTWLVLNGYMHLYGMEEKTYTLTDLFDKGQFWVNTDWSKTKAYALGLGQVYANLQGREKLGIVAPGDEYSELVDELAKKLLTIQDPQTGQTVIVSVYKRDEIYHGDWISNAPDLVVGFKDGYRVSWQTTLGGIPHDLIEPNMKKWSGDHSSMDYRSTPGVFLSNRRIEANDPRIIDIAPTVCKYFDLAVPKNMDGHPLI
jgi:predicted AlkP superfamily phosphohydrolase/phosphomutase